VGNILNSDFRDFLVALKNNNVEYILVGGYAVILHGYSRTTGDLDIWVNKTKENYNRLVSAFKEFKMPLMGMTEEKFLNQPDVDVFTYGRAPVSIDIMTSVKGLNFQESYQHSVEIEIEKIKIRLIDYRDLIAAKKSSGRFKDLDDLDNLKK
jgi:hypothetical protein